MEMEKVRKKQRLEKKTWTPTYRLSICIHILYYIILYCIILYYIISYHIISYHIILYYIILYMCVCVIWSYVHIVWMTRSGYGSNCKKPKSPQMLVVLTQIYVGLRHLSPSVYPDDLVHAPWKNVGWSQRFGTALHPMLRHDCFYSGDFEGIRHFQTRISPMGLLRMEKHRGWDFFSSRG